ncbi:MAG TPA: MFS transporter [Myxococcota bacterium]|nr:MFS transporter [Myxococcota bacterium]
MRREPLLTPPFLLCALANFAQSLSFNLYLHLPGFLHQLGAGEVQIGLLFGVTAAAAIAVRPPLGRAIDRGGRRRLVLGAVALNVVVCLLYLTVDSLGPWVYAVRIAHGFAEATLFTVLFVMAADRIPASRRTEGLALYSASGMLPISLGGLLGDGILAWATYDALFAASALAAAIAFACSLALHDVPRAAPAPDAPRRGFLPALAQRDLAPLWFLGVVFGVVLAGVFTFVKRFVMEEQVASVGTFFTAYTGAAIAVRLVGGSLPDRVGPRRVLLPALATLSAGFACLAAAEGAAEVLAAGVLCGLGHGFTFPILSALAVTRSRESERGAAISILTALPDVGALLGAPSLGWIIEVRGFGAMFATAAGLLLAGTVVFAVWDGRAAD